MIVFSCFFSSLSSNTPECRLSLPAQTGQTQLQCLNPQTLLPDDDTTTAATALYNRTPHENTSKGTYLLDKALPLPPDYETAYSTPFIRPHIPLWRSGPYPGLPPSLKRLPLGYSWASTDKMGGSLSKLVSGWLWTKKEIRILILGLVRMAISPCSVYCQKDFSDMDAN